MKKYGVDHICLAVKDLDAAEALFAECFGMELVKRGGTAPSRKVWLDGGIQLNEVDEFDPKGGMDHFAIDVPASEREEIFAKLQAHGCKQAPGLTACQWVLLPEGQMLELTDVTKAFNQNR